MKIVIKNPAPRGRSLQLWGDFHFGKALEAALVRQGAEVVQHFWPDWDTCTGEDAVIWLRGKRRCTPRPGVVNAIWILSHPSAVTGSELEAFDIVYAGSARLASELHDRGIHAEVLRQCTDSRLFRRDTDIADDQRKGLVFIASSRGVRRPILEWALESGLSPIVIGQGWDQVGSRHPVHSAYVANDQLPALYNTARYGMNDHWGDMAHFQIINNRVFDCLACGLPLLSDSFPELEEVAGDGLWTVHDARSFKDAYWSVRLDYAGALKACRALWDDIGPEYTFDARAVQIMHRLGGTRAPERPPPRRAVPGVSQVLLADLLERAGGLGSNPARIRLSMLHVMPRRETSGAVSQLPSLSAVSAGLGSGPWHVRLDGADADVGDRRFDVVFIEDATQWKRVKSPDTLLSWLLERVKPGGLIAATESGILDALHRDPRVAPLTEELLVYRRTVENPGLLMLR